jgi:hypothetical protein
MVAILSTTIITCSQALAVMNRLSSVYGLTHKQKNEIILELRKIVPSCPVKIIKEEN